MSTSTSTSEFTRTPTARTHRPLTTADPVIGCALFEGFDGEEMAGLVRRFAHEEFAAGVAVVEQGTKSDAMYVVLEGQARILRNELALGTVQRGDCFGEVGALTGRRRASTVRAIGPLAVARLAARAIEELIEQEPDLAMRLMRNLAVHLRRLLTDMTDTVSLLLQSRSHQQRTEVTALLADGPRVVKAGTPIGQLLPETLGGVAVVAALLDRKPVSRNTPLFASARIEPLLADHSDGRQVNRASMGLMLLEAARGLVPRASVRMGPSLGFAQIVEVGDTGGRSREVLARELQAGMAALAGQDLPFRSERWNVEEASAQLNEQGWQDAAHLFRTWRDNTVPLVSCGQVYAYESGPMLASTGRAAGFELVVENGDLLLYFGDAAKQASSLVQAVHPGTLAREHEHWLMALGATSVGAFNELCISGDVGEIIRVSEGFHEKRISQIADEIANAPKRIRAICISGPSSAGKTTFIKRLSVQLQVNGIHPRILSLDDYYVDREKTVRDENGVFDFEAFEAINHELLGEHMAKIMAGEAVPTARYDFATGSSHPSGGPIIELGPSDVLLLEGIHAFHPLLPLEDGMGVHRVFINPMTSLPIDDLTRVSVSDVRLLRRIVRDRYGRAIPAADNIVRWSMVRRGEWRHIFPNQGRANAVFNTSLIYELSVLKVYAERYLLEVPSDSPAYTTAYRLRRLIDHFVAIYPYHVPPNSLIREFIGGDAFRS